jgi:TusA-related sulfurtransferase
MLNCLDLRGRSITTYIAGRAAEALHTLAEGEVLELHTDDDRAIDNDLRAWCAATGTGLDATKHDGDGVRYLLTKHHADPCLRRSLALVVSDAGLEELLSPLGFAALLLDLWVRSCGLAAG